MPLTQLDDGTQIHYINKGKGSKKLLFIHGNLANTLWWESTLNKLSPDFEGFAIDLPGSGQTPETGKRHTMEYFTHIVYKFTEKIGLDKFYLIGHSMGGMISQLFTLNYPEKVIKLVLLDSGSADGFHVLFNLGDARLKKMRKDKDFLRVAIQAIAPYCKDKLFLNKATDLAFQASEQVYLEQPITMHEANWINRLNGIKCPVLFLHGDKDDFVPKDGSQRTANAIPHCAFRYLKDCGHSPMVEVFDDYFNQVFDFIEKP